jgi:hypothetical protein
LLRVGCCTWLFDNLTARQRRVILDQEVELDALYERLLYRWRFGTRQRRFLCDYIRQQFDEWKRQWHMIVEVLKRTGSTELRSGVIVIVIVIVDEATGVRRASHGCGGH